MKALCIKSYAELQALVSGQAQTIEAKLVDTVTADNPENGLQQLMPYLVFYHMDMASGKLKFIQYLRPAPKAAEGEEQVPGVTSIGFGKAISDPEMIVSSDTITGVDGEVTYLLSLQNIMDMAISNGLNDVVSAIGIDLPTVLGPQFIDRTQIAFFNSDAPFPEMKVRTGISLPVPVTAEQFELIRTTAVFKAEEIEKLDTLGINIDMIVEQMDVTPTITSVINELIMKYNLEPWSTMMFNYISRKELHEMLKDISYNDIVALVHAKRAALAQIAQNAIEQQRLAAEAAAVAETGTATLDAGVETAAVTEGDKVAEDADLEEAPAADAETAKFAKNRLLRLPTTSNSKTQTN